VIAYVDSSVVLRIVLPESGRLAEWPRLHVGVASPLVAVECHRTLDRYWREGRFDDEELEVKRSETTAILTRLESVALDAAVLRIAAQPFPSIVATLDAIHLASAITYRTTHHDAAPLLFATHDHQLARAARAMHFEVIGT
jgi:predicted nucleic acid-binding protein